MPDFDIDFEDDKREQVIDYIFNKYQKNHVCHIITFQRNKIKAAIRDVARILEIDLKIVDGICKLFSTYDDNIDVLITTNNDIKKIVEKYQELFVNVRKIINIPRQCGIHAAGLVICGSELINTIPITYVNDHIATQFSME
jgi:DNA polymerase-3 subunit alpha